MTCQGDRKFLLIAEIRSHKIRAYQEEDDVRCLKPVLNFGAPLRAGFDIAVMPVLDKTPAAERTQVLEKKVLQFLIRV
jgi:hypothetical protein